MSNEIKKELLALPRESDVEQLKRYLRAYSGGYGEGDCFYGIRSGPLRKLAKQSVGVSLEELDELLTNSYHESRALALMVMIEKYKRKACIDQREEIAQMYLNRTEYINNWDLVDISSPNILGCYLYENKSYTKSKRLLMHLFEEDSMWDRRIAILAGLYYIRKDDYRLNLLFSEKILCEENIHDLLQKAVGWMLREIGKRNESALTDLLDVYAAVMPRTMLRYSLEKLPKAKCETYMKADSKLQ